LLTVAELRKALEGLDGDLYVVRYDGDFVSPIEDCEVIRVSRYTEIWVAVPVADPPGRLFVVID
jgi:hypothetical protein